MLKRSLAISEASAGPDHPDAVRVLFAYAALLKATNRVQEVATMEERAKAVLEKNPRPNPP